MKTIRLALTAGRFDDQYTFDLQGYLSVHDFCSTVHLFNEAVRQHPPPGHKAIWVSTLAATWILAGAVAYATWFYSSEYSMISWIILPVILFLTTGLWVWQYRRKRRIFQHFLVELCSRINATENIRGINYRFQDERRSAGSRRESRYALILEFDDRYRALMRSQDDTVIQVPCPDVLQQPENAHLLRRIDEKNVPYEWQ
ncbi:hypothetical protein VTP01DRAFT_9382 [Rhizomucor pusillus]|uniref:uncharacterized protein n=1 Tax=Rhizomucor pusillus TaxID=4840 RepID=UPI003743AF9A